jgi:hypothetical protein
MELSLVIWGMGVDEILQLRKLTKDFSEQTGLQSHLGDEEIWAGMSFQEEEK